MLHYHVNCTLPAVGEEALAVVDTDTALETTVAQVLADWTSDQVTVAHWSGDYAWLGVAVDGPRELVVMPCHDEYWGFGYPPPPLDDQCVLFAYEDRHTPRQTSMIFG